MTWNREGDSETMQAKATPPDVMEVPVCRNPIFIIGAPRSGTTALAYSLGTHSELHTLPETHVLMSLLPSKLTDHLFERAFPETFLYTQGVDKPEFQTYLALGMNALFTSRSQGKRWVDHTPFYALIAPMVAEAFPGAKFIHILRDARRVVHSMVNMRNAFSEEVNAFVDRTGYELPAWIGDFKAACREWRRNVEAASKFSQEHPDRCLTVVNERLAAEPDSGFRDILQFLDLPYEGAPADYFRETRVASSFPTQSAGSAAPHQRPDPWDSWTPDEKITFSREAARTLFLLGLAPQEELLQKKSEVETLIAEADARKAEAEAVYQNSVEYQRRVAADVVPAGKTVLVVSHGEDALLQITGRQGWHFPQDEEGYYTGGHPADSQEAIDHLKSLQRRGAEYLLVPDTAHWWLDHYVGFQEYLNVHARRVWDDDRCIIFDLSEALSKGGGVPDVVSDVPVEAETSAGDAAVSTQDRATMLLDRIPLIQVPADYATEMPRFMARTALEVGPIFRRPLPWRVRSDQVKSIVYMVGPEANQMVMQTHRDHFSHELGWTPSLSPAFAQGLLNMDDPEHAYHRKLMNPAFDMAHMSSYLPMIRRIVANRTDDWVERAQVDLADQCRSITFDVVAKVVLGLEPGSDVDRLQELFYPVGRGGAKSATHTVMGVSALRQTRDEILLQAIRAERAAPGNSVLGMIVAARDDNHHGFTDEQLLGHVQILLAAGHETTTSLAATLLYLLSIHPAYLERVRAEIDSMLVETGGQPTVKALRSMRTLGNAVNEAARLGTAGNGPRGVIKDFEFAGYTVPAGARVLLSAAGCHRLPTIFENPDAFDPDRFAPPREEHKRHPFAFLPFGGGTRPCIGINLAQIEVKALAVHVLSKYALEVVEGQDIAQAYYAEAASIYPNGIYVRVAPRA